MQERIDFERGTQTVAAKNGAGRLVRQTRTGRAAGRADAGRKPEQEHRNVLVRVRNHQGRKGFEVVLVFSGREESVLWHPSNGLLFCLLEDDMPLAALRRWRPGRSHGRAATARRSNSAQQRLAKSVTRLVADLDKYLATRAALFASADSVFGG